MKKFFTLHLLFFLCLLSTVGLVTPALAAGSSSPTAGVVPVVSINIGDYPLNFSPIVCPESQSCPVKWISEYIVAVYRYGVGLAGVLAVIMIMIGGFLWLTSGGNTSQIGRGKEFITAALTGLLIALFSYLILNIVNPKLTTLESPGITEVRVLDPARNGTLGTDPRAYYPMVNGQPVGSIGGLDTTLRNESFRANVYEDPLHRGDPAYNLIGYGSRVSISRTPELDALIARGNLTEDEARQIASYDYRQIDTQAANIFGASNWNMIVTQYPERAAAFRDMIYQMGPGGMAGFTQMVADVNAVMNRPLLERLHIWGTGLTWNNVADDIANSRYATAQTPDRAARVIAIIRAGTAQAAFGN